MSSNIIFCFTGTGNSLKAAKDISVHMPDCTIASMSHDNTDMIHGSVQVTGFIFPVYYLGLPLQVRDFIENVRIPGTVRYVFAIATCGRFHGNSIRELNGILKQKGIELNYGNYAQMGDNAIALYNAKGSSPQIEQIYGSQITNIIQDISSQKQVPIKKELGIIGLYHMFQIKNTVAADKGYHISDRCVSCGICQRVCPAKNIQMVNGAPEFKHHCQRCMACIQLCPKYAINYKNKTQRRMRYHNPGVTVQDLVHLQSGGSVKI